MGKYDDLLRQERVPSKKHGQMPVSDRAKQFAPFAAVKGHMAAIRQKERIVADKIELSEDTAELLDYVLRQVQPGDMVRIVYYDTDQYVQITGLAALIDRDAKVLQIVHTRVPMADIYELEIVEKATASAHQ